MRQTALYNSVGIAFKELSSPPPMESPQNMASQAALVSLATDVRPPRAVGPDAILRMAAETGAGGIHVGGGCDLEVLGALVTGAARLGLPLASATLPLPERPVPRGRRLPRLVATAPDERAAAIALVERGLLGLAGGPRAILLDFGRLELTASPAPVANAFARRALDDEDDTSGARVLAAALDERRASSGQVLDACRWAVEALLRAAERAAAVLVLPIGVTPWEAPSPREVSELLTLFAGAPIGSAWDPGRLSALGALGLPVSDERLAQLAKLAALHVENDAVGLRAGYLPGLGERDPRIADLVPNLSAPIVVCGDADVSEGEIRDALAAVTARREHAAASSRRA